MSSASNDKLVAVEISNAERDVLGVQISGRLEVETIGTAFDKVKSAVKRGRFKQINMDLSGVEFMDSAGAGLIIWVEDYQTKAGGGVNVQGLSDNFAETLDLLRSIDRKKIRKKSNCVFDCICNIGKAGSDIAKDLYEQVVFVGEIAGSVFGVIKRANKIRWADVFLTAESVGADAFGIIALIGFLLGLILAYQSVYTLKNFGAEIYVADIVSLSLFRELGPLMTAIVLAGRSGSAFAAEIGTMKVNEEIDALVTMGLEPVSFLAFPRILAAVIVTPMLGLVSCFFGIVGAGLVMLFRGFPVGTFYDQVCNAVDLGDMTGGIIKSFVFGVLIASIGCLRGLQTQQGARSVGVSATRAVVSGIVLLVVTDGIFAVVYNLLGI